MQSSLFAYIDGSPVLRRAFDSSLRSLLVLCGLSSRVLNGMVSEYVRLYRQRYAVNPMLRLGQPVDAHRMLLEKIPGLIQEVQNLEETVKCCLPQWVEASE